MTRILVLGGTGLLGRPVVDRLVADGRQVRVLSRDPDRARASLPALVEVVGGDVTDPGSVVSAVSGCDGVHISVGGPVDRASAEVVARVASGAGVERVTYVSGSTVDERNRWFPMVAQKLDAEAALIASDVPCTMVEALREYCAAAHPGVEVGVLPVAAARALASESGDPMLSMTAEVMAYFDAAEELGDPTEANAILGAPTTTLAQWIDRGAGFRSPAPPTS
jgi:NAD(P)-dependent dehydrogenase (short-subunit alcohol dehydrogenase family)